jgi:4-hydroxythreonine-4-phosphate dehydrogenase
MAAETNRRRPPLALTMGDPAGIGIEIALMAWHGRAAAAVPPFVLFADPDAVAARARALRLDVPIEPVDSLAHAAQTFARSLPVHVVRLSSPPVAGRPDGANAGAVIRSIEEALASVVRGETRALVTNPIAKGVLYGAGFKHAGHTEFLASLAETGEPGRRYRPVMMLAADELRVVPLTVHIPLADVARSITGVAIRATVHIMWDALRRDFGLTAPRIAVAGLNPHAGEGGALGREEEDVIAPAIRALRSEGLPITGPHSADTLFHAEARARYDAVLAMYHDQALIPLKTLAFDRGVNVTLGLPFVRTSPDHGTAFDIAGTGTARPDSLVASLRLADTLSTRRAMAHGSSGR